MAKATEPEKSTYIFKCSARSCGTITPLTNQLLMQETGDCDPSDPDVCIAPCSQVCDLDCRDVEYRRFRVDLPDSHNFEGGFDCIVSESG